MKASITAALMLIAAPALAEPAPAGKCSLIDNGVAQVAPTASEKGLHSLSMPLPKGIGETVADVTFRIQSDGTVSDVKMLCVTGSDGAGAAAIVKAVKDWRFAPVMKAGKPVAADAAYRVSAAGAIPLNFTAGGMRKIEA